MDIGFYLARAGKGVQFGEQGIQIRPSGWLSCLCVWWSTCTAGFLREIEHLMEALQIGLRIARIRTNLLDDKLGQPEEQLFGRLGLMRLEPCVVAFEQRHSGQGLAFHMRHRGKRVMKVFTRELKLCLRYRCELFLCAEEVLGLAKHPVVHRAGDIVQVHERKEDPHHAESEVFVKGLSMRL